MCDARIETENKRRELNKEIVFSTTDSEVRKHLESQSSEEFFVANVPVNWEETLGSVAVRFGERDSAEEFLTLVRERGGGLRLSSAEYDGWFLYEGE